MCFNLLFPHICKILLYILIFILFFGCKSEKKEIKFVEGSPEFRGYKLYYDMACNACHTVNGSLKLGPSLKAQYGKKILHTDGTVLIINDNYIKESINYPLKYIVEGYTPIMPSYKPILNDADIDDIIAYIKTLQ